MLPVFDVSRIIGIIKSIVWDIAKFAATKVLLIAICVTILPISIYYGWCTIMENVLSNVTTQTTGMYSGTTIEITGFGAWLGYHLQIGQCLSIFISALSLKFVLSFFRR